MVEDACGVCGGDGTECEFKRRIFKGGVDTRDGTKTLLVLPRGARSIKIQFKQGKASQRGISHALL